MKKIKYGLRYKATNKILGYAIESNEGREFCCSNAYILDKYEGNQWLVDTCEQARFVKYNSTEWYNAAYETPTNPFNFNDLEIVKVEIETTIESVPENKVEVVKLKHLPGSNYAFIRGDGQKLYMSNYQIQGVKIIVENHPTNNQLYKILHMKNLSMNIDTELYAPKSDFKIVD